MTMGSIRTRQANLADSGWQAEVLHDLRGPLSVVRLQAQLLLRVATANAASSDRSHDLALRVDRIERAVAQMAGMLNELQDIGWSDGPLPTLRRERADVVELARRIAEDRADEAPEHSISVQAAQASLYGYWDVGRLERAIANLVGNAVKYSPAGGEVILQILRERTTAGDHAAIAVRDTGIGIPDADLPHIFRRFYRAGNVAGRFDGAGLGLASARSIVEQHGGTVAVHSREGHGTTVIMRLPLELLQCVER